ncbi:vomeronasal type-2 receptor 26-like [Xenopus tropicalis]|uniref:Vomeronasal type-2 receptor 26-like n=1 Tax=Xenopus tropicalis TaxID=8364 RepID=A0A8J1JPT9_XENTR|nr:vomeronasal type-2 receptor 26-like [Xenopus tropicalis]
MLVLTVLLQIFPAASDITHYSTSGCVLWKNNYTNTFRDGDFILGAVLHLRDFHLSPSGDRKDIFCMRFSLRYYRHLLVFKFAIEEINRSSWILPNVTLGYQIFDSCGAEPKALSGALDIFSGRDYRIPNYACLKNMKLIGLLGDLSSTSSYPIAQLAGLFRYPQVSYGATDPVYNDRIQFPSFYRTVPNELSEMNGIVQILKHFGWKWVGLIVSSSESGKQALDRIRKGIESYGGCVAFSIFLSEARFSSYFSFLIEAKSIVNKINQKDVDVIVLFLTPMHVTVFKRLFSSRQITRKIWLSSSFFPTVIHVTHGYSRTTLNGTLSLSAQGGEIPGFETFLYRMTPINYPNDDTVTEIWETLHECSFTGFLKTNTSVPVQKCSGNESLDDEVLSRFDFRVGYQVYTAVYALAHSLHNLFSARAPAHPQAPAGSLKHRFKPWQLNAFINNVTYKTPSGDIMFFKANGDPPAQFDIVKWLFLNNGSTVSRKVGHFDESNDKNHFYINSSADLWSPYFTEMPRSLCSEPCSPGYRKSKIEGEPPCCYDCVQCGDGEMSNTTDAVTCVKCPEDQKSNRQKTDCVPKALNFLSYMDTLGASLASAAIILFITTSVVMGIFVKYWETPIVRANNQNLSCLLLISLMLCFLCTLLFIGRPTQICCLLRQVTFGIVFTISVSSVLAKTLTVIIAFNATKPGSKLKKYVGTQLAIVLVIICSLGSTGISAVWMASYPPFLEVDMFSEMDTIILLCNEGSVTFFFCIIGYIGTLALLSFIAAFLAKDFPDRFNEAKNITFSMLGFCSVWGAFVPAYLSSKGSRMVAVEIFAILSSSAGLLGCIFAPKCYIIFLRPELNIREIVARKA